MTLIATVEHWQELFRQARAGSNEATGRLLEIFRPYLLAEADRHIDSELRPKGGASDLVQQTFLKAHAGLPAFRGHSPDEMIAWLRQILLNNAANFRRHYRQTGRRTVGRELSLDRSDGEALAERVVADERPPDRALLTAEQKARVENALGRLPDDQRRLVVWRNLDAVSFRDIAGRLGVTEKAAQKRWGQAILALQKLLTEPT